MQIESAAYRQGERIPKKFTCDGDNISPPFSWRDVPPGTNSLVLIVHDPDAPRADGFVHWIVYDILPEVSEIPENRPRQAVLQGVGTQGRNDSGNIGYVGPCPPSGTHRYFARLYALRDRLGLEPGATYEQLLNAMEGKIIDEAEYLGKYSKEGARAA
jgi:Raf kinase inhibitor-like YbhB/YbcL family protein